MPAALKVLRAVKLDKEGSFNVARLKSRYSSVVLDAARLPMKVDVLRSMSVNSTCLSLASEFKPMSLPLLVAVALCSAVFLLRIKVSSRIFGN